MKTIIILIVIAIINIFFGYWWSNTKKLTLQWIMAIHIPVPIAIVLRLTFLGWNWMLLPGFIGAFAQNSSPVLPDLSSALMNIVITNCYCN